MWIELLFHLRVNDFIIRIQQSYVDIILATGHHLKSKEKLLTIFYVEVIGVEMLSA